MLLEPRSNLINCLHTFTSLENEVMLGNSEDHLVNALVQIEQFRMLLLRVGSRYSHPRPILRVQIFQDIGALSLVISSLGRRRGIVVVVICLV